MNKRQRKKQAKKNWENIIGPIKIESGIRDGMFYMDALFKVKVQPQWACKVWGL